MNNKDAPITDKIPTIKSSISGTWTKTQQIVYYTVAGIPKFTEENFMIQNGISNKSVQTQKASTYP